MFSGEYCGEYCGHLRGHVNRSTGTKLFLRQRTTLITAVSLVLPPVSFAISLGASAVISPVSAPTAASAVPFSGVTRDPSASDVTHLTSALPSSRQFSGTLTSLTDEH